MAPMTLDDALRLAIQHHAEGRFREAETLYRSILEVAPGEPHARHGLGLIAGAAGRGDPSPQPPGSELSNFYDWLGYFHLAAGRLDEAEAAYRQSLAYRPGAATVHGNLGVIHARQNRLEPSIAEFERAIALDPALASAHDGLSMSLLLAGDLRRGWEEQEWRWKIPGRVPVPRHFTQAEWDGRPLAGRTLLAYAEQGFGDTIQFARFVRELVASGARVVFETPPEVYPLFAGREEFGHVVCRGQPLPPFDVHCALMTLPRWLGATLETIAAGASPYLRADPPRARAWRERIATPGKRLVGVVWAGNPDHAADRARSVASALLAPLAGVRDARFFSLQKGYAAIPGLPAALWSTDLAPGLRDFADTAALLAALDLLITVDTAVAHLAGALGHPVWTLLPHSPDWRWLLDRRDTPWYPGMRLYRQPAHGDWASVIRQVTADLNAGLDRAQDGST